MDDLTRLVENAKGGDARAVIQLYEAVYAELRAMAAHKMASERPARDEKLLQVHEALARESPLKAAIVKLRYFVDINQHEIEAVVEGNKKPVRQ